MMRTHIEMHFSYEICVKILYLYLSLLIEYAYILLLFIVYQFSARIEDRTSLPGFFMYSTVLRQVHVVYMYTTSVREDGSSESGYFIPISYDAIITPAV